MHSPFPWMVGWLVGWLVGCLEGWLYGWLAEACLHAWAAECLGSWTADHLRFIFTNLNLTHNAGKVVGDCGFV
jgi:hypothetical protein